MNPESNLREYKGQVAKELRQAGMSADRAESTAQKIVSRADRKANGQPVDPRPRFFRP